MINTMDYTKVVSDKKLKGSGLSRGDVLLVVGTKQVPAKRNDPYLMRTLFWVARVVDGLPCVSNDDTKFLVDPRSLEKVSEEDQKNYEGLLKRKYETSN